MSAGDDDKIPNPYLADARRAKGQAQPHADAFETALSKAENAMTGGAWVSSSAAAQNFSHGLAEQTRRLKSVHAGVPDAFDEIISVQAREPMVDRNSWQARRHNL